MKGVVLAIALVAVASSAKCESLNSQDMKAKDIFADALAKIEKHYVQPFDSNALIDGALTGAMNSLDPHSTYLTKQELEELSDRKSAPLGGIGLELTARDGRITVIAPVDGSPAASAGFKSGDVLLAINGVSMIGLPTKYAVRSLRGPVDSKVTVSIARMGANAPIALTLTRASVKVDTVTFRREAAYGYIRIMALNRDTDDELRNATDHLGKVKGYILDLRNNGGGLLDTAVRVAGEFLVKGTVLSLKGRTPENTQIYEGTGHDLASGKPIVVLVNAGTASGAEAIAGALQDNRRAKVIGRPTFGEGSVQTIIPLNSGGALRLTTALMVLPSGRLIQEAGIVPDKLVSDVPRKASPAADKESTLDRHILGDAESRPGQSVLYPAAGRSDDFQLTTAIAVLDGSTQ